MEPAEGRLTQVDCDYFLHLNSASRQPPKGRGWMRWHGKRIAPQWEQEVLGS